MARTAFVTVGILSSAPEERKWIDLYARRKHREGRDHLIGERAVVKGPPGRGATTDNDEQRIADRDRLPVLRDELHIRAERAGAKRESAVGRRDRHVREERLGG